MSLNVNWAIFLYSSVCCIEYLECLSGFLSLCAMSVKAFALSLVSHALSIPVSLVFQPFATLSVKAYACSWDLSLVPQPCAALSVKACACHGVSGSPALCRIECKNLCVLLGCPGSPTMPCISFSSSISSLVSTNFFFGWLLMLL